jgi:hypothetical protein
MVDDRRLLVHLFSIHAKSPMRSLSVVGVWVFEFPANHRLSGNYPKTEFCPDWRQSARNQNLRAPMPRNC